MYVDLLGRFLYTSAKYVDGRKHVCRELINLSMCDNVFLDTVASCLFFQIEIFPVSKKRPRYISVLRLECVQTSCQLCTNKSLKIRATPTRQRIRV